MRDKITGVLFVLVVIGMVGMLYLKYSSTPKPVELTKEPGDIVKLTSSTGSIWSAATEADLYELVKYQLAHDDVGVKEILRKRAFIALDAGTKVRVISIGPAAEVRLLDGPYRDKAVFVDSSHIPGKSAAER